jgi:hypothetical protein
LQAIMADEDPNKLKQMAAAAMEGK